MDGAEPEHRFEAVVDPECPAGRRLAAKYRLGHVTEEQVRRLHDLPLPNVNGNEGGGPPLSEPVLLEDGLFADVVPRAGAERLPRGGLSPENYNKYGVSERTDSEGFREWHEVVDAPSYDGETLRILPYVVID